MKTNFDEIPVFVSVVDSGSISAAAEQLEQTASDVSRALSQLEEKLAVTLLRRTTRRLELTEEGEAFLAQARRILASVEEAEEEMALRRQALAEHSLIGFTEPDRLNDWPVRLTPVKRHSGLITTLPGVIRHLARPDASPLRAGSHGDIGYFCLSGDFGIGIATLLSTLPAVASPSL